MSDQEIRALERQLAQNPADADVAARLVNARRRSGIQTNGHYVIQNSKNGKYYHDWYPGGQIREVKAYADLSPYGGIFKTREAAFNLMRRLQREANIDHYRLVEVQTLELPGPLFGEIKDQMEMELLQAKKEAQLAKLQALETKEQALLEKKKLAQHEKLKKLEAAEAKLQKRLAKGKKDNDVQAV